MAHIQSRRSFIGSIGWVAALGPVVFAQGRAIRRIGFITGGVPELVTAFESEMLKLGYVDGKNIIVEKRIVRINSPTDLPNYAQELGQMDLDLIVAASLPVALAVRRANPAMPMVIATCPGMIKNGFAKTMKRPGGIYTGIDELPPGVTARRLKLLKTIAPRVSRVALLSTTPGTGGHETQLADAERAATALRVRVKAYRATTLAELNSALAAIKEDRMDGLLNFQGALSLMNRDLIIDLCAENRVAAIYQSEYFAQSGGLMTWAPSQPDQFRMAARYVDKILKGSRPRDLPIVYPPRYYLTINKKTLHLLGLTIPRGMKPDVILERYLEAKIEES